MKNGICIYCGEFDELTRDHVPPECFFPNPKPSNLITVDSCLKCNKSFDKDEEYMFCMITMRHDVGDHQEGKKHLKKLERIFKRPNKLRFAKSIANKTEIKNIYTTSGLYLGQIGAYEPDGERITNFMKKMTYGIYSHETRRILPKDNRFIIFDESNFEKQNEDVKKGLLPFISNLINGKCKSVGGNVFKYNYMIFEDNDFAGIFFFCFFDYVKYFTITIPTVENLQNNLKMT